MRISLLVTCPAILVDGTVNRFPPLLRFLFTPEFLGACLLPSPRPRLPGIVGVVCLVLFGLLLLVGLYLAWKVRSFFKGLSEALKNVGMASAPATIHLVPAPSPVWQDPGKVAAAVDAMRAAGFDQVAIYSIPEMPGVQLQAFCNVADALYGVVYEHPHAGVWADVVTQYENGEGITASNAPMGGELDHMPGREKIYDKAADIPTLIAKLLAARKPLPTIAHTAEAFVAVFEHAYAEEMEWRDKRGGASEAEIQRMAAKMEGGTSPEQVKAAQQALAAQAAERLEERCLAAFLASGQLSDREKEELADRLFVVTDLSTIEPELEAAGQYVRDDEAEDFTADDYLAPHRDKPRREAFRAAVFDMPLRVAYRHVGTVSEPVEGDVWARPHSED